MPHSNQQISHSANQPFNLYYTAEGKTAIRYRTAEGVVKERIVPYPAALLTAPPDPEVHHPGRTFTSPREAMFYAFRTIPLCPNADWRLAEEGFLPTFREAFGLLLEMLRRPPEERWCTRGEPEWFLQFGLRTGEGWTMASLVLPCGKPAAITFRCEDMLRTLPPAKPTGFNVTSWSDSLPPETTEALGNLRIKLPLPDNGGAIVTLTPLKGESL